MPDEFFRDCEVCAQSLEYGPHRHELRRIALYDIFACTACLQSNWDGWAPHLEERVVKKLRASSMAEPKRLENGSLLRE